MLMCIGWALAPPWRSTTGQNRVGAGVVRMWGVGACAQYISLKDLLQEAQVQEDQADRQNRGTDPQD